MRERHGRQFQTQSNVKHNHTLYHDTYCTLNENNTIIMRGTQIPFNFCSCRGIQFSSVQEDIEEKSYLRRMEEINAFFS